ncbi:hypothetical protein MLD38_014142 [Melastoma candidum]|uniref:Uncharacterized protein n=1 Tax=Melastoma candidum TaxID=119954 RepID=A0ACB9RD00_9MYRT|nr:hypothetical protein MLD38_014142 [Melastoma candidum]
MVICYYYCQVKSLESRQESNLPAAERLGYWQLNCLCYNLAKKVVLACFVRKMLLISQVPVESPFRDPVYPYVSIPNTSMPSWQNGWSVPLASLVLVDQEGQPNYPSQVHAQRDGSIPWVAGQLSPVERSSLENICPT